MLSKKTLYDKFISKDNASDTKIPSSSESVIKV